MRHDPLAETLSDLMKDRTNESRLKDAVASVKKEASKEEIENLAQALVSIFDEPIFIWTKEVNASLVHEKLSNIDLKELDRQLLKTVTEFLKKKLRK